MSSKRSKPPKTKSSSSDPWTSTQNYYLHLVAERYEGLKKPPLVATKLCSAVSDMLEYLGKYGFLDLTRNFTEKSVYARLYINCDTDNRRNPNEEELLKEWNGDKVRMQEWIQRMKNVVEEAFVWRGGWGQFEKDVEHHNFHKPPKAPWNSALTAPAPPYGARERLLGLPAPPGIQVDPEPEQDYASAEQYRAPINIYQGGNRGYGSLPSTSGQQSQSQYSEYNNPRPRFAASTEASMTAGIQTNTPASNTYGSSAYPGPSSGFETARESYTNQGSSMQLKVVYQEDRKYEYDAAKGQYYRRNKGEMKYDYEPHRNDRHVTETVGNIMSYTNPPPDSGSGQAYRPTQEVEGYSTDGNYGAQPTNVYPSGGSTAKEDSSSTYGSKVIVGGPVIGYSTTSGLLELSSSSTTTGFSTQPIDVYHSEDHTSKDDCPYTRLGLTTDAGYSTEPSDLN